jgi:hypothetical protein
MHNQFKFYYFVAYTPLNMFQALLCPSSGAPPTAFSATGYRMIAGLDVHQAVVGLNNKLTWVRQFQRWGIGGKQI